LVFQLAKAVWNPPRPSYFADDLVDTQRLGVAAAERCQHVLEAVFLARLGFGESNRADHEAAITACTRAVERASARRCLGAVGGPVHPCPCVHHLSGNPGSACGALAAKDREEISLLRKCRTGTKPSLTSSYSGLLVELPQPLIHPTGQVWSGLVEAACGCADSACGVAGGAGQLSAATGISHRTFMIAIDV
jgi:hypothetical protein